MYRKSQLLGILFKSPYFSSNDCSRRVAWTIWETQLLFPGQKEAMTMFYFNFPAIQVLALIFRWTFPHMKARLHGQTDAATSCFRVRKPFPIVLTKIPGGLLWPGLGSHVHTGAKHWHPGTGHLGSLCSPTGLGNRVRPLDHNDFSLLLYKREGWFLQIIAQ